MLNDKFLVILGGNKLACPAIEHLTKNGYNTLVVDRNPHQDAYDSALKVEICDFFDINELRKTLSNYEISGIMPINDFGVENAAIISEERKLFGNSVHSALNVKEKHLMKTCWKKSQLPTPEYTSYELDNIDLHKIDWNKFPCIVKPSFVGGGSRGVHLIGCKNELNKIIESYKAFSSNHHLILEEFIEGTEHTIEVLIWDGKTHLMSVSDKKNYPGSATIVQDLMFPGPKGNKYRKRLEILLDKACKALGLEFGCAHFEVIIDDHDEIWLIEVGGRPGGGLNFHPISILSTGYDYPLEYTSILTTGKPHLKKKESTYNLYWHFFCGFDGILDRVDGWDFVCRHKDTIASGLFVKKGEFRSKIYSNDLERPGYVLFKYESEKDLLDKLNYFDSIVKFILLSD